MARTKVPDRSQRVLRVPRPAEEMDTEDEDIDIQPDNVIEGVQLLILHAALCLTMFLVGLDFNLIATAIPTISSEFNTTDHVGWYGAGFYIALCATQPFAGKAYVLFAKKLIFLGYLAIFELGSLLCALAPNSHSLIVGRAIAGVGASGIFAGSLVIITTIMPLHKLPIWQGTLNATFGIASLVGPIIGGALTEEISWRWCFYINLPIGGVAAAIITVLLHIKPAQTGNITLIQKLKGLDGVGFVLLSGAVTMLLLALQWGGHTYPWDSSTIIGLYAGFGLTLSTFVVWQLYLGSHALIPPSILTNRNVILLFLGALLSNGPFQTIIYYLPIWFQVLGSSPMSSGIKYLPTVITDVLTSLVSGAIVMKTGHWKPFLLFGNGILSIGSGLLTTLQPGTPSAKWIGYQILVGAGYPLIINMAQLGVQASLPSDIVHIESTTLLFGMSISCAISLAIGQAVFQLQLAHYLSDSVSSQTANSVLSSGVTQLDSIVRTEDRENVLSAYSSALTDVFYISAVGPIASFVFVLFTTWVTLNGNKSAAVDVVSKNSDKEKVVV